MIRLLLTFAGVACLFCCGADPAPTAQQSQTTAKKPDVGYYATTQDVVEEILKQTKVSKTDLVCDLGCGDGRFPITAARIYGCRGVGYEIDPEWVKKARDRAQAEKVADRVDIRDQDIFTADLSQVTVVTLFLLPELNKKLIPQLDKLPTGARIVTHEFEIPGLIPDRQATYVSKQDESEHLLFYYTTPLKKARQ